MPGIYIYSPAELVDLSESPLVAPPVGMVTLTAEDMPGPSYEDFRPDRMIPSSGMYTLQNNRRLRGTGRRPERKWVQGSEVVGSRAPIRFREEEPPRNAWQDPSTSDNSGFGGFEQSVAEFEKWKQAQRGITIAAPEKPSSEQTDLVTELKDVAEMPKDSSADAPVTTEKANKQSASDDPTNTPQAIGSSSRFSTFFKPQAEPRNLAPGATINPGQQAGKTPYAHAIFNQGPPAGLGEISGASGKSPSQTKNPPGMSDQQNLQQQMYQAYQNQYQSYQRQYQNYQQQMFYQQPQQNQTQSPSLQLSQSQQSSTTSTPVQANATLSKAPQHAYPFSSSGGMGPPGLMAPGQYPPGLMSTYAMGGPPGLAPHGTGQNTSKPTNQPHQGPPGIYGMNQGSAPPGLNTAAQPKHKMSKQDDAFFNVLLKK